MRISDWSSDVCSSDLCTISRPEGREIVQALGASAPALLGGLARLYGIADVGVTGDRLRQKSENFAFFTHNVFNVTDRLAVTVGARWTHDKKKLDATFLSDNSACDAQRAALAGVRDNPAARSEEHTSE